MYPAINKVYSMYLIYAIFIMVMHAYIYNIWIKVENMEYIYIKRKYVYTF